MSIPATDHSRAGSVLRGEKTWDLDQFSLHDKIINIKFKRRDGETFCIRSDYEVVFDRQSPPKPYFIPIRQKPSIKVDYKQVSNGTAINVNIRIANLHIINENLDNSIFTNQGNPIVQAELWMGYRRQFPDWTMPPLSFDNDDEDIQNRLDMFYDMKDFTIKYSSNNMETALRMVGIQILTVQPEGLPPDRSLYIQGIIGTLDYGLRWVVADAAGKFTALENYFMERSHFPDVPKELLDIYEPDWSMLEKIFQVYITHRFFKTSGIQYQIYDSNYDREYDEEKPAYWVRVLDYDEKEHKFLHDDKEHMKKPARLRWSGNLERPNNLFSPADAANLGVICNISDELRRLSKTNNVPRPRTAAADDEDNIPVQRIPCISFQSNLGAQLKQIQAAYPDIRWYQQMDGSFYFYHKDETVEQVIESTMIDRAQRHRKPLILPAVYDISVGGTRTIRCPFIGFISPGQELRFTARYNIADLVGYFYPTQHDARYRAIICDVVFDTDGEDNMMTIMAVDIRDPKTKDIPEGGAANESSDVVAEEETRTEEAKKQLRWRKIEIAQWVDRAGETARVNDAGSWSQLINNYIKKEADKLYEAEDGPSPVLTWMSSMDLFMESSHNSSQVDDLLAGTRPVDTSTVAYFGSRKLPVLKQGDQWEVPYCLQEEAQAT